MDRNGSQSSIYRLLCLLIILLAFALRAQDLGGRSLWFDESMEYWIALSPLSALLSSVKASIQDPPLYSLLLHFWLQVGHTEYSIRFLSLVFSLVGILGVIVLSRVAFGKKTSLVAGLLMAVSVPDIRFAQEAGQYALMSVLLIWNFVFLYMLIKENVWKWAVLWGISAATVFYSYYGAALALGATTLLSLGYMIATQKWGRFLKLLVVGAFWCLSVIPLVVGWLPDQMLRGPTTTAFQFSAGAFREELQRFFTQTQALLIFQFVGYQPDGWPWAKVGEWWVWLPSIFLISISAIRCRIRLPVIWFLVGLLIHYFVGRLGAYPFGGRYSLILSPLFWICLAAGVVGLSTNRLFSLRNTLAVWLLGLFVLIALLSPLEPQEDLRSVSRLWLASRRPDEPTYVYYGAVPGFRYQLNLAGPSEPVPALWYRRCWQGRAAAYCANNGVFYGRWIRSLTPEQKRQSVLATIGGSPERFWMVFSHIHPEEDETILAALQDTYRIVTRYTGENSALFLLQRQ